MYINNKNKMIHNYKLVTFCLLILVPFTAGKTLAQDIQSDVSGFYGNINVHYGQWSTSSQFLEGIRDYDPNGLGLQLSAGYGFKQRMELFAQFSYSDFNMSGDWSTYNHTELGVGFRYNFGGTLSKLRPFLDAQISSSSMTIDRIFYEHANVGVRVEGKLEMEGVSLIGGGGVRYFFRPWIAGKVHARFHHGGDYDMIFEGFDLEFPEKQDVTQFDIGIGVTWYFGKRF